jgi:hypothetical protein
MAHIAADKDTGLILAVETTAANEADVNAAPSIIPEKGSYRTSCIGMKTSSAIGVRASKFTGP